MSLGCELERRSSRDVRASGCCPTPTSLDVVVVVVLCVVCGYLCVRCVTAAVRVVRVERHVALHVAGLDDWWRKPGDWGRRVCVRELCIECDCVSSTCDSISDTIRFSDTDADCICITDAFVYASPCTAVAAVVPVQRQPASRRSIAVRELEWAVGRRDDCVQRWKFGGARLRGGRGGHAVLCLRRPVCVRGGRRVRDGEVATSSSIRPPFGKHAGVIARRIDVVCGGSIRRGGCTGDGYRPVWLVQLHTKLVHERPMGGRVHRRSDGGVRQHVVLFGIGSRRARVGRVEWNAEVDGDIGWR